MSKFKIKHGMPIQMVSTKSKTDEWFKESAKAAFNVAIKSGNDTRKTFSEKIELYDLYNGITDDSYLKESFNTVGIKNVKFNPKFQHYPLVSPRVDLLLGELTKRSYNYTIGAVNPDAISMKLQERKQKFTAMMLELYTEEEYNEEYIKGRLDEFEQSDVRSTAEMQADELLNYYKVVHDFEDIDYKLLFSWLTVGEHIGCVELINGRPVARECDNKMIYIARDGGSDKVVDAEIIVEITYEPVGDIIETYFDHLSKRDVDKLIGDKETSTVGDLPFNFNGDTDTYPEVVFESKADLAIFRSSDGDANQPFDGDGNYRVAKIKWKGFRKIKRLKEHINGNVTYRLVSEFYEPDITKGEEIEVKWITEWHEHTLVGSDIWVDGKICELQFRSFLKPYESKSGYFGKYNIKGSGKARSLLDRAKPLSYYYDMVFARLEDMLSKNIGKVIELDVAKIPEGWNPKLWLYYLKQHNVAVVNSFKEGDKGLAMGKLAGSYNTTGRGIDMELGNSIVVYIQILAMIEDLIAKVTGITDQRLGQISARELVGNVERSTIQSNHVTESYFNDLDKTREEYYLLFLDAARYAHKKDKTLLQYATSDMNLVPIELDGELLSMVDLGIFPSNNARDVNFAQLLRSSIQQQFANGNGDIESLAIAHSTNSFAKLSKSLKEAQEKAAARQDEAAKKASEYQRDAQLAVISAERERDSAKFKHEENLLRIKLGAESFSKDKDTDNNGIDDSIQLTIAKLNDETKREEIRSKERIEEDKIRNSKNKTT